MADALERVYFGRGEWGSGGIGVSPSLPLSHSPTRPLVHQPHRRSFRAAVVQEQVTGLGLFVVQALGLSLNFVSRQMADQRPRLGGRHEDIDEREALAQRRVRLDAHHATHERDHPAGVELLQRLERPEVADRAILGALAHHARVEHDDIGVLCIVGGRIAQRIQLGRPRGPNRPRSSGSRWSKYGNVSQKYLSSNRFVLAYCRRLPPSGVCGRFYDYRSSTCVSEKCTNDQRSGKCVSYTPWLFSAQAGCGWISAPPASSFSKRPKNMRQVSPSCGGSERPFASHVIPAHGNAISTNQPRSTVVLSLIVPSTCTADRTPGKSQSRNAQRRPRGCVPHQKLSGPAVVVAAERDGFA